MTSSGYPPIADADWPAEIADLLSGFAGNLNVYRVMAHNPALLRAWAPLRGHVVQAGALSEQQREIVILRTGWHWRSDYEWAHHTLRGRRAGLSDARIERTRAAPESWTGDGEDTLLLRTVEALLTNGRLDPSLLADVRRTFGDLAPTDIMATIGFYTTLAFIVRSFETPIDGFVLEDLAE